MSSGAFDDLSMHELFGVEVDNQAQLLTDALLMLEANPSAVHHLETGMRSVHSLKGASRIVGLEAAVKVAHLMEECLVMAQRGSLSLKRRRVDLLLDGVDLLKRIAHTSQDELMRWSSDAAHEIDTYLAKLQASMASAEADEDTDTPLRPAPGHDAVVSAAAASFAAPGDDRVLRVTAENLNRLLGLASESLVASRWMTPFAESLLRLKRMQAEATRSVEDCLSRQTASEDAHAAWREAKERITACSQFLSERLLDLETFARRGHGLAQRLYDEALASRMRPFADGVAAFPRMVRDLGKSLGKQVTLVIRGQMTQVDRDISQRLEAPLTHLLRNAVDHGIESPEERLAAGKPAQGLIALEAWHNAGMLQISITDDGRGIATGPLRDKIVERGLTTADTAARMSEDELMSFLFLPGFTMKDQVSEVSGRGVGLDVVHDMVKQVRGSVHVDTVVGQRTRFRLQLPLTLSVVRALLADVGGQPYAFPLAHLARTLKLPKSSVEQLEGRQYFELDGKEVGLVTAHQVLQTRAPALVDELAVIVVGIPAHPYGLVVDRFLGEHDLVVQPLDARLRKVQDITAGALMEDGSPVLIVDVEDMIRSMDKLSAAGAPSKAQAGAAGIELPPRKRVLVIDDSLTVRQLERKLLEHRGYEVEVAVDGMDGWNAVRTGDFDLIVTDVDMPRMDGIELVRLVKQDLRLKTLPVLIVSYKDREDDRRRGLDAGADYYLTKDSFHDERLLEAVVDLIGEASS